MRGHSSLAALDLVWVLSYFIKMMCIYIYPLDRKSSSMMNLELQGKKKVSHEEEFI